MAVTSAIGNLGGSTRVRFALPGHDANNMSLDPRFVAIDSQWQSAFRLFASGRANGSALTGGTLTDNFFGDLRTSDFVFKQVAVAGIGPDTHTALCVARHIEDGGYVQCAAIIGTGFIRMCPMALQFSNPVAGYNGINAFEYIWFVFAVPPAGFDPVETGTAGGMSIGPHPSLGQGLFIARRGVAIESATDADLILSTRRNCFQAAETGLATIAPSTTEVNVTLAGSYPSRPVIYPFCINYFSGASTDSEPRDIAATATWVNNSTIKVAVSDSATTNRFVRFMIIATDPLYAGGTGAAANRIIMSRAGGFLGVTKVGINYTSAGWADWVFRSDRLMFHARAYGAINPGALGTGWYAYPVASTSGAPFTFFRMLVNGASATYAFAGCGSISAYCLYGLVQPPLTTRANRRYFMLKSFSATQYYFAKGEGVGFPSGVRAHAAVVNVANM